MKKQQKRQKKNIKKEREFVAEYGQLHSTLVDDFDGGSTQ
jgi:hypothetical protein